MPLELTKRLQLSTPMSEPRPAFSVPLFAAFQALMVLGYAVQPHRYRPLIFIPIASISYYLIFHTDAGVAGFGIGDGIAAQTLYAFECLVLMDVQKSLYRIGEKPGQIETTSFSKRLSWSWHLYNSPRGVRWAHEISHIPKNTPALDAPEGKKAFILSRILTTCSCVALQGVLFVINSANPALVPGAPRLINQSLYIRILSLAGLAIPAYAQINVLHCLTSIICVAAGFSEPVDWPPLFGSPALMYSVQSFWRNVWHQMLRRPVLTISNLILHTLLRLPRPSLKSKPNYFTQLIGLLKLHTAFLISACVHFTGEYMMQGYPSFGAFKFFALQSWAITFEIIVKYLITGSTRTQTQSGDGNKSKGAKSVIWRILGYAWVISWFVAVAHHMQQPMIDAGIFVGLEDSELTRRVGKWLALEVI